MDAEAPTGSQKYFARRMAHKFLQYQTSERTNLLEAFPEPTREFLLAHAALPEGEVAVFGYFQDEETWLVASSRRVTWSRLGQQHSLMYPEVVRLGWSAGPEGAATRKDPRDVDMEFETPSGMQSTKHSPWLFIYDVHGNRHELLLENGGSVITIWNSLNFAKSIYERHCKERQSS
jgi:hypothetical protein